MAARGAIAKENIATAILETFPGSFKYDKEIRIPMMENGEQIQIKVTLTAAKTNVDVGGDVAMPGEQAGAFAATPEPAQLKRDAVVVEPTEQEKENVKSFLNMLGL
jgi:hypothetical protein